MSVVAHPRRVVGTAALVQASVDRLDHELVCLIASLDRLASSELVPSAAIAGLRRLQAGVDEMRKLPAKRRVVVWREAEAYIRRALWELQHAIAAQVGAAT